VKRNAIAGRRFPSWGAFVAHLERWAREIADQRVHGTTGETPIARFAAEAGALRPLGGRAPFGQLRDLVRKVKPDCAIDLDTNSYSVPWRLVGETVSVLVLGGRGHRAPCRRGGGRSSGLRRAAPADHRPGPPRRRRGCGSDPGASTRVDAAARLAPTPRRV
jgi:hypothetical protein